MPNYVAVNLHPGGACGKGFRLAHAHENGEGIFGMACGRQFHDHAIGIDEGDARPDTRKSYRLAFLDLHLQTIGQKTHHGGGSDPGNLFELLLPLGEWNKVEVVAKGDTIQHWINGKLVLEGSESSLTKGKINLQSEGAEIYYRNIELTPLE